MYVFPARAGMNRLYLRWHEAGKIPAAVERFDQLGDHDLAWARVFQKRLTMAEQAKAESVIAFYLPS